MENEVWVQVKGASNYLVSNLSRIKSVERIDNYKRHHKERILVKSKGTDYDFVTIYDDQGNKKPVSVYSVVFWSFNPDIPKVKGYEIDHIDDDKTNDNLSNLQYITSRKNSTKRSLTKFKTSKFTGVSWDKARSKWQVHIRIKTNGISKSIALGRFDNEERASEVYQGALKIALQPIQ